MNLKLTSVLLMAALLFALPAQGAVNTAGIPADAHIVYGADFTSPVLQGIAKTSFDKIKASPEYGKFLAEFKKEAGFAVSPEILDRLLTLAGFRVGLTINKADPDLPPGLVVVLQFKDASLAALAEATLKDKCAKEFAKDIVFGELQAGARKLVSIDGAADAKFDFAKKMFKKVTVNYLVEGDQIAIYFLPKEEAQKKSVLAFIEGSLAAFADPAKSIGSVAGVKDLLSRAGGDSPILFYASSDIVEVANKQDAKIPPVIEYIGMTTIPSADYLIMKSKVTAKLKDLEKNPVPLPVPVAQIKSLLQGGACAMDAFPKDTLFALGFTLNLTKDILALPPVAAQIADMKKNGIDLEEKFLKWFDGDLAVAIGAYAAPTPEEIKKGEFNTPDVFLAFRTKDAAATMKSVEELLKLAPFPLQPVDKKEMGENVKNVPFPMMPPTIKKFDLHYGVAGAHFLIATTKDGMQKALAAAGKKEPGLVDSPEFKESVPEKGFAAFYANIEELTKLSKVMKDINPQGLPTDEVPAFQKRIGVSLAFPGDSFQLVMGTKADYVEAIDFMLKEFKNKFSGKAEGAAPAPDAKPADDEKPANDEKPAPGADEDEDEGGEADGDDGNE